MKTFFAVLFTVLILCPVFSFAVDDETCFECHSDPTLTMEKDGKEVSIFVRESTYMKSVHADNTCVSCHEDADVEEMPHDTPLQKVAWNP